MELLLWILLGAALAVAEIFTTTLFLIMFSIGAFAAAGAAALGAPVELQAGVFIGVSALTLFGVRPLIRRRFDTSADAAPIGMQALPGTTAVVLETVDEDRGMVKIDGELWQARCLEGTGSYAPGERVRVIEIRGATALVWRDEPTRGTPDVQP